MIKHAEGENIKLTMKMSRNKKKIQVKGQLALNGNGKVSGSNGKALKSDGEVFVSDK